MGKKLEMYQISSLEKLQFMGAPKDIKNSGSCLKNELYSYQIAYKVIEPLNEKLHIKFRAEGKFAEYVNIKEVAYVQSDFPAYYDHDTNYENTTPGLFPDPLLPIEFDSLTLLDASGFRALWITISAKNMELPKGNHEILIAAYDTFTEEKMGESVFKLSIIDYNLAKQELLFTDWLWTDCIANYHKLEVFSEDFWQITAEYIGMAAKYGMNTILTPVFTPPIDTYVGGERTTTQLMDVAKNGDSYSFNFDKLGRWIQICIECGITHFEMPHIITQWDAKNAPKIMGTENGEYKRIFGWETDAHGECYHNFLKQYLVALKTFAIEQNLFDKFLFHISDEPSFEQFDKYASIKELMISCLGKCTIIDAMSDYRLYEQGAVQNPIPALNHMDPFIKNNVPNLWTYYCCGQNVDVSNRFFSMPSARNRIIGFQMYKYNIKGFLHWGFNFYNSQLSRKTIDPYRITDSDKAFPSGDPFCVYPYKDGCTESLRLVVFHEAIQDLRACYALEEKNGREFVLDLLEGDLDSPITFTKYPTDAGYILTKREKINSLL